MPALGVSENCYLPVWCLTHLGLFLAIINAARIELLRVVPGFAVDTFGAAFVVAIVLALVTMFFPLLAGRRQNRVK